MSVTITIRVEDGGAAASFDMGALSASLAGAAGDEAPRPGLFEGSGDAIGTTSDSGEAPPPMDPSDLGLSAQTEDSDDGGEGPPPMDLSDSGMGSSMAVAAEGSGPPPEDLVEAAESDETEAPEPMPVEDLDEPKSKSSKSKS